VKRLEDLAKEGDSPVDSFPWFDPKLTLLFAFEKEKGLFFYQKKRRVARPMLLNKSVARLLS
jgi:hypothetical protein